MRKTRAVRRVVGFAAAATISVGVAAPVGFAQDPGYVEEPPTTVAALPPGSAPAPLGSPERALQLKRCKNKAKTKFGDNQVKKKAAIKKCKKKYG
jgi:hypothetical protein